MLDAESPAHHGQLQKPEVDEAHSTTTVNGSIRAGGRGPASFDTVLQHEGELKADSSLTQTFYEIQDEMDIENDFTPQEESTDEDMPLLSRSKLTTKRQKRISKGGEVCYNFQYCITPVQLTVETVFL